MPQKLIALFIELTKVVKAKSDAACHAGIQSLPRCSDAAQHTVACRCQM
jgi:hypothetical protein